MAKKSYTGTVLSALLVCWLVVGAYADEAKEHITIAVFPCTDPVTASKRFGPLITYLEQETGFDVEIVVPMGPIEFETALKNGDIDFAFQNARTYVRFADFYYNSPLLRAVTRKGTITQSGAVIAKKGSGIDKIEDLRGKLVLFGPKHSTTRWVAAKLLFEESGLNIDKDLQAYSHGGSCEAMAFSVQFGGVDAAVVCDHFLEEHSQRQKQLGVKPEVFVVIGRTRSVPTRVFASRRHMGRDTVNKVYQALLRLDGKTPVHDEILQSSELGGFQKAKDEDYDATRRQLGIETAR